MEEVKDLFVHIGHGKTGSSAIQSYLATNQDLLSKFGINYPSHSSFDLARQGRITSGNGSALFDESSYLTSHSKVLFSSESFFSKVLNDPGFLDWLRKNSGNLTVICFVRDIFDLFPSAYVQRIKRGGGFESIEDFAKKYFFYRSLRAVIAKLMDVGCCVKLVNYSRHKKDLITVFMGMVMSSAEEFLSQSNITKQMVNRSLDRGELELQRLFNKYLGSPSHSFISDPLVNELPAIGYSNPILSKEVRDIVLNNNLSFIHDVNSFLPESERILAVSPLESQDQPSGDFLFSYDQIDVLVRNISNRLVVQKISSEEVNLLRDVALCFDNKKQISLNQAVGLMEIAHRVNPNAPFIKKKLVSWKRCLDRN